MTQGWQKFFTSSSSREAAGAEKTPWVGQTLISQFWVKDGFEKFLESSQKSRIGRLTQSHSFLILFAFLFQGHLASEQETIYAALFDAAPSLQSFFKTARPMKECDRFIPDSYKTGLSWIQSVTLRHKKSGMTRMTRMTRMVMMMMMTMTMTTTMRMIRMRMRKHEGGWGCMLWWR